VSGICGGAVVDQLEPPTTHITDAQLRRWLALLVQPHRIGGPSLTRLLERHGRLPQSRSPVAIGAAAAQLLTEKVEALDPGADAARERRLPYLVLEACFMTSNRHFEMHGIEIRGHSVDLIALMRSLRPLSKFRLQSA
jgi:hypothetical protein